MGYVSVAVRSKTPSGVAGFLWNQWQLSRGIGGSFAMESVATFVWNEWQLCYGISGRFGVEYAERIRPLSLDKATSASITASATFGHSE